MAFLPLIIVAWFLYFKGYKISALILFLFFVTGGFQIVPEEAMETGFGFSKGVDFALIILVGWIVSDSIFIKNYLKVNFFVKYIIAFFAFLFICVLYSKFVVNCTWVEIIRTTRSYFLFLIFFVFRNMTTDELKKLFHATFFITICISVLYLSQILLDTVILTSNDTVGRVDVFGIRMKRFYGQPLTLHFFVMASVFCNPYKGIPKYASILILVLTLLFGFHRSLTSMFIVCLVLAYIIRLPRVIQVKVVIVSLAIFIPVIAVIGHSFMKSRTFIDVQSVISGNFAETEFDLDDLANSTFAFRMGHLWERMDYLSDSRVMQVIGAGLIPEDSKKVDDMFDFNVGLLEDLTGKRFQLETSDICYSILIIRFGYVGALFFLFSYIYMMGFFYKRKENPYAFFSFLYIVLSLALSFFSINLIYPISFVLPVLSMCLVDKMDLFAIPLPQKKK